MQVKPHQIAHFAEQQRRFKQLRNIWHDVFNRGVIRESGSYFSRRFKPWVYRSTDGTINVLAFEIKYYERKTN